MELRQLKYFRVIAETKSFNRASAVLRISQPALSRQIKLLEAELRTDLFIRDGRGVQLTSAGHDFFGHVTRIEARLSKAVDDISKRSGRNGKLAIGIPPSFGPRFMTDVTLALRMQFPDHDFVLIEDYSYQLIDWVNSGRLELAIVYGSPKSAHLTTYPFSAEQLFLITAPQDDMPNQISFKDLAKHEIMSPAIPSTSRSQLEAIAETNNIILKFGLQIDSLSTLRQLVADAGYRAVLPFPSVAEMVQSCAIRAVEIVDPTPVMTLSVIASSDLHRKGPPAEVFEILQKNLNNMIASGYWRGVSQLSQV